MRKSFGAFQLPWRDGWLLTGLWLVAAVIDRLWLVLDHGPPAWDQGDHLSRALAYWHWLQQMDPFSGSWWTQLWQLSPNYRGPLVYLLTAPFLQWLGPGVDQATLVNLLFSALLMTAVYWLGRQLFDRATGLWVAGLTLLAPLLVYQRTDYLLDYGLTTFVTGTFTLLTLWRRLAATEVGGWRSWLWGLGAGTGTGLTFLVRPTGLLFLVFPWFWLGLETLSQLLFPHRPRPHPGNSRRRTASLRLLQLLLGLGLAGLVAFPWFKTNWLTILTSSVRGSSNGLEHRITPASWLYYGAILPQYTSWPILILGSGAWLLLLGLHWQDRTGNKFGNKLLITPPVAAWLGLFWLGAYNLCSLATNKDPRFMLPAMPVFLLLLALGLRLLPKTWGQRLRWLAVGLALGAVLVDLFPLPLPMTGARRIYQGAPWPHSEVVREVRQTQPYLQSTLGVLPNLAQLNPMNINFYGQVADFQVFGREIGLRPENAVLDSRSLVWYLAKTGDQGDGNRIEAGRAAVQKLLQTSQTLQIQRTWPLPDGSELTLYRRRQLPIVVRELPGDLTGELGTQSTPDAEVPGAVQLRVLKLPAQVWANQPAAVSYQLLGSWSQLQDGLLLLDWQPVTAPEGNPPANSNPLAGSQGWRHDHAIALGQLRGQLTAGVTKPASQRQFQVSEHLAMLPNGPAGTYRLSGHYLNRRTGLSYPLSLPAVMVQLRTLQPETAQLEVPATDPQRPKMTPGPETTPKIIPQVTPEPDLLTQLAQLGQRFRRGELTALFPEFARINQYDPRQDYLVQANQSLGWRLQQDPNNLDLLYTLALSQALQRQPEVIHTLHRVSALDSQNPYAWMYLAVVHLYFWQPRAAEPAIARLAQLRPTASELKTLQAVAAVMQLNLPRAWSVLRN